MTVGATSIKRVPTADLIPCARNSRTHGEAQVARIAATLIRNVERDIRRSLKAESIRAARTELTEPEAAGHRAPPSIFGIAADLDADRASRLLVDRLHARSARTQTWSSVWRCRASAGTKRRRGWVARRMPRASATSAQSTGCARKSASRLEALSQNGLEVGFSQLSRRGSRRSAMQKTQQIQLNRIPGRFRLWELGQVLEPEVAHHIKDAGDTDDGGRLVAVCRSTLRDEGER